MQTSDAGPDTQMMQMDAAMPLVCPAGTHVSDDGTFCDGMLTAQRSMVTIAPVRDHHTTFVYTTKNAGTFLYVIAGTDAWNTVHDDVQRAKINDDGTLGAFQVVSKLPGIRAGHCTIVSKGRIHVLGGTNGKQMMASTTSATIDPNDGTIGMWNTGPDLVEGVMHQTCDLVGDYIYVMGGRGVTGSSTATNARAKIASDGTIAMYEKLPDLVPDRSHHESFVLHDRLYLAGGLTGDPVGNMATNRKDVVFAPIMKDGSLGAWQPAGDMQKSVSISAATVYGEAVYILGGYEGGSAYTDKIRRFTFAEDGTIASEAVMGKLPSPRGHVHQQPMFKTFMYSVGGHDNFDKSMGSIDVLHFM